MSDYSDGEEYYDVEEGYEDYEHGDVDESTEVYGDYVDDEDDRAFDGYDLVHDEDKRQAGTREPQRQHEN